VLDDLKPGDSVSINGVCLTATKVGATDFLAQATPHTYQTTTLGEFRAGRKVNLERALKAGERLGGHIVQGHIDAVGRVARIQYGEGSTFIQIDCSRETARLVAPKGSVALDGVSLTIADKSASSFMVMLIPFTIEQTTLGELTPGARVNIETDIFIRWLAERFADNKSASLEETLAVGWGKIHFEE